MWFFFLLVFLLFVDFWGIVTLPFIFLLLLGVFLKEKSALFVFAFVSGLILDVLLLRPLGITSLFFVLILFVMLLYGRKFEIQSPAFIFAAAFFGEILYLFLFNYGHIFSQGLAGALVALILWGIINKFQFKINPQKDL